MRLRRTSKGVVEECEDGVYLIQQRDENGTSFSFYSYKFGALEGPIPCCALTHSILTPFPMKPALPINRKQLMKVMYL